jgi:sialate O-acetylesterase
MKNKFYICLLSAVMAASVAQAKIVPNSLFSNHAVLQQGVTVPVWGTADKDEQITVELNGQRKQTREVNGKWMLQLDPLTAGGPYAMTIAGRDTTITMNDIYVGEVWVCSGQSNMNRRLGPSSKYQPIVNWEQECDAADYPLIREFYVDDKIADEPVEDAQSKWVVCSPETVVDFSCVGYFFARDLYKALKVPVGMLFSAVGGTPAESWTSRSGLESNPEMQKMVREYEQSLMDYPRQMAIYKQNATTQEPRNPFGRHHVSCYFNGMIHPLQPYAIKGVIWYQGESNSTRSGQYYTLFPLLIKDWRQTWGQGDFPFLFVQMAPYKNRSPELCEAQFFTSRSVENTAMVVTTDCGDANDIHPTHKQPVGYRLSLTARAIVYHEKLEYSGPVYEFMEVKGDKAILYFSHVGKGLVSKGGPLKGFVIAGSDNNFVPAKAEIKGNTIIVSNPGIKEPVAVRYGWANVPDVNLFNAEGLPATPFRTDVRKSNDQSYLFSYFKGNGTDGLHLAYSKDGLNWTALKNDSSFLQPVLGKDRLMRDPSIVQDEKGVFHLVWTTGWEDQGIGYAYSTDLIHWSEQKNILVMKAFEGTKNTWAPELFYNQKDHTFYIFWSSTVPGMFSDILTAEGKYEKGMNHRQFYVTTKDFETFSETLVFFDPGFSVIDGTILEKSGTYYLFVKNENSAPAEKNIRVTSHNQPHGFPVSVSAPITGDYWAEGPSALQVGKQVYVYFDKYTEGKYGAVRSNDMVNWEDVSDIVSFPNGIRHGTAFAVPESILNQLK